MLACSAVSILALVSAQCISMPCSAENAGIQQVQGFGFGNLCHHFVQLEAVWPDLNDSCPGSTTAGLMCVPLTSDLLSKDLVCVQRKLLASLNEVGGLDKSSNESLH